MSQCVYVTVCGSECVCMCVCARARARVSACVFVSLCVYQCLSSWLCVSTTSRKRLEYGLPLAVHTQTLSDVQVILTRAVAQVEVILTGVTQPTARAAVARGRGHAHPMFARAIRAAQAAVDLGIADVVVGAVLVHAASFGTVTILHTENSNQPTNQSINQSVN